ncbi:hypothetical protein FoTM2_013814 [Fusarium oxysporum f. sp. vasinfectum]|nr:hypothetical protein FoTM2_013814 [Fusarium oxysporum f. sp. vasinfectum]
MANLKDNQGHTSNPVQIIGINSHWLMERNSLSSPGLKRSCNKRYNGDDRLNQGWLIGDKGYLRCLQYGSAASIGVIFYTHDHTNLVTSEDAYIHELQAEQLAGNSVSLGAYNRDGKLRGLRVGGPSTLSLGSGDFPVGLDCEFAKVSNGISKGNF